MGVGSAERIGTAGWSIPALVAHEFTLEGSGLRRYASQFQAVEINTTFYRSHRGSTYARWRDDTPPGFRFAVKAPRAITHVARLACEDSVLEAFLLEVGQLGAKLGPVLVQLPPSLKFDRDLAETFFGQLRRRHSGELACEPRHPSWFEAAPEDLLRRHKVARVAADPPPTPQAARPGGWTAWAYWRLHGSPKMYFSTYEAARLEGFARSIGRAADGAWCIFDNTASGAAAANALQLKALILGEAAPASARIAGAFRGGLEREPS